MLVRDEGAGGGPDNEKLCYVVNVWGQHLKMHYSIEKYKIAFLNNFNISRSIF